MKKLLLILLCVPFFYACKSDNRNALKIETWPTYWPKAKNHTLFY